jgi:multiple sugar transport system substrate-binding protein
MKLKKAVIVVFLTIMALFLAAGCRGKKEAPGGAVEINLWAGFTGADMDAMGGMINQFMQENQNIKVVFYSAPWNEMFTKFATGFGTSSGPDLLVMHATDIPNYATRDMLTALDDLKDQLGVSESNYARAIWDGNAYNGTQWGIPLDYHPVAVFKNVSLFKEAGLDPEMKFQTKESFLEAARALTKNGRHGVAIGVDHAHSMRYWYSLLYQAGGDFLNADETKAVFNGPQGVEALTFLTNLIHTEGVVPPMEADIDRDWLSGNVAMVIEGPWFLPAALEAGFEFTTAPFPQIFTNQGVWAGSHTLTIPNHEISPKRREAAITLLGWLSKNSLLWGISSGQIPASKAIVTSGDYVNQKNYKYLTAFLDQAEFVHYEPLIPKTAEIGADNQLSPVLNAVYAALRGERTPQETLTIAAREVDAILKQ